LSRRGAATPYSVFVALSRDTLDRSATTQRNGFDSRTPGFLLGADYLLFPSWRLGLLAGFKYTALSFSENGPDILVEKGEQTPYTTNIGAYGSYPPAESRWYGYGSLLLGILNINTLRAGGAVHGSTSGYRLSLLGGGGYDF